MTYQQTKYGLDSMYLLWKCMENVVAAASQHIKLLLYYETGQFVL